ncbi:hypothetical protein HELRODRAFT_162255 [Helobdella robusta]|uniref:Reelin n=1 Tax=Helobdella robusta TaxID=6412 RepID=T1ESF3_HELRO|nr:hypothetical protein HELRODRAFT_162255 [Helobdella robusta]ESN98795.1 hypothetical protein HELRODRAFT_162255 [Helobdella robusta]
MCLNDLHRYLLIICTLMQVVVIGTIQIDAAFFPCQINKLESSKKHDLNVILLFEGDVDFYQPNHHYNASITLSEHIDSLKVIASYGNHHITDRDNDADADKHSSENENNINLCTSVLNVEEPGKEKIKLFFSWKAPDDISDCVQFRRSTKGFQLSNDCDSTNYKSMTCQNNDEVEMVVYFCHLKKNLSTYEKQIELETTFNINLPEELREPKNCVRWVSIPNETNYTGSCWGLDDVLIKSSTSFKNFLFDNFNDIDASNWLFFNQIKLKMLTERSFLHFENNASYIISNDLTLNKSPIGNDDNLLSTGTELVMQVTVEVLLDANFIYDHTESVMSIEYSGDYGAHWNLLHEICFNSPACYLTSHSFSVHLYDRNEIQNQQRHTILLSEALNNTSPVRFRWSVTNRRSGSTVLWNVLKVFYKIPLIYFNVLTSVYVGHCREECWSRSGDCLPNLTCRSCEGGGVEKHCTSSPQPPLHEDFADAPFKLDDEEEIGHLFSYHTGASSSYSCGVLSSGRSMVFNEAGLRMGVMRMFNTTGVKFLRFSLKVCDFYEDEFDDAVNNKSYIHVVAAFVLVEISCDSGVKWKTLKNISLSTGEFIKEKTFTINIEPRRNNPPNDATFEAILTNEKNKLESDSSVYSRNICNTRIWQPADAQLNNQVWALDDVVYATFMHDALLERFHSPDPELAGKGKMIFDKASVGNYCQRNNVYRFQYLSSLETNALHVNSGHIIQFKLAYGCSRITHLISTPSALSVFVVKFSVDNGKTWNILEKGCVAMGDCDNNYKQGSIFHPVEFYYGWKNLVIVIPKHALSPYTRFKFETKSLHQFYQSKMDFHINDHKLDHHLISNGKLWALDDLYIGPSCPDHCNGHGECLFGECNCDAGFQGESCRYITPPPMKMNLNFSTVTNFDSHWQELLGGKIVTAGEGCGVVLAGESLYFYGSLLRRATTRDLCGPSVDFIQFYLKIGGSNNSNCLSQKFKPRLNTENNAKCYERDLQKRGDNKNLLLSYTRNGGATWDLLKEFWVDHFRAARFVHIALPPEAQTGPVQFRFWQPVKYYDYIMDDDDDDDYETRINEKENSYDDVYYDEYDENETGGWNYGDVSDENHDLMYEIDEQWAIDDLIIDSYETSKTKRSTKVTANANGLSLKEFSSIDGDGWMTLTDSMIGYYCSSAHPVIMFNLDFSEKIAMTTELIVQPGDVLQFKINVGCSQSFNPNHPVYLEYSINRGMTWHLVKPPCYQAPGYDDAACTKSELMDASVYYEGGRVGWVTEVVPLDHLMSTSIRTFNFRWLQSNNSRIIKLDKNSYSADRIKSNDTNNYNNNNNNNNYPFTFALSDVYVGPACYKHCFGQGLCSVDGCLCFKDFKGKFCEHFRLTDVRWIDKFDATTSPTNNKTFTYARHKINSKVDNQGTSKSKLSKYWSEVLGASVGLAACYAATGDSGLRSEALNFNNYGTRMARTFPLDVTHKKSIQFLIQIGLTLNVKDCKPPRSYDDRVIFDYSTNNGITWTTMKQLDPHALANRPQTLSFNLARNSKSNRTVFRWWQLLGDPPGNLERAGWSIDDVVLIDDVVITDLMEEDGGNEESYQGDEATHKRAFADDANFNTYLNGNNFNSSRKTQLHHKQHFGFLNDFKGGINYEIWSNLIGGFIGIYCKSGHDVLVFSKNSERRYIETWDFPVSKMTFIQFELVMLCGDFHSTIFNISLDFSVDQGRTWYPVVPSCYATDVYHCTAQQLDGTFNSAMYKNWKRVTIPVPTQAVLDY